MQQAVRATLSVEMHKDFFEIDIVVDGDSGEKHHQDYLKNLLNGARLMMLKQEQTLLQANYFYQTGWDEAAPSKPSNKPLSAILAEACSDDETPYLVAG